MTSPEGHEAREDTLEATGPESIRVALASAVLEPEPVFDRTGIAVPIVFIALKKTLQDRIDTELARLPSTDEIDVELVGMKLKLAAGAALADIGSGRSGVYLLPLDFAFFASRERRDRLVDICWTLPETVVRRVTFMLSYPPGRVSPGGLREITDFLQALGAGVGLLLDDAESVPDDLPLYGIELVALSAASILATPRVSQPRLAQRLRDLKLNGVRLIARHAWDEEERIEVTRIGADMASFAVDSEADAARADATMDEETLKSSALAAAIKSAPVACVITNVRRSDNPITSCNPVFTDITGYAPKEVIGRNWRFLQGRDTNRQVLAELRDAAANGVAIRRAVLLYRKDGAPFWTDLVVSPVHDDAGELLGMVALMTDITALRAAEASRRSLSDFIAKLTDTIPGFVFQRTISRDGNLDYAYVSPSFHRLIGVAAEDPNSNTPDKWIHPDDLEMVHRELRKSGRHLTPLSVECRLIDAVGEIHWIRSTARPVRGPDGAVVWNGVAADITPEKLTEERLSYLATHDSLTGLLNRREFRKQLSTPITRIQAYGGAFGVLSIDISYFHPTNDAFGSVVEDSILQIIAERIAEFSGVELAARVGGAEFIVALVEGAGSRDALAQAHALRREIAKPIEIDEHRISTSPSMGLALYPNHIAEPSGDVGQAAGAVIKAANVALFTAKREGPGYCHVYSPGDVDQIRDRAALWHTLFEAYENRQFALRYQPIVDLKSGWILGAEAILHWSHPELRLLRPDQFIPLAERVGLIAPLGAWVLDEALRNLREWGDGRLERPWIAINIAAAQLQNPEAFADLSSRILASDANPAQIEIELSERDVIDTTPRALNNLASLRALGVTVALDSFGAGYASLGSPRSLPIDKIKINRSFVGQMTADSDDEAIVRGTIAIGRDLGLTVVADGVETAEQRDILLREGCRVGQGGFYSNPVTAEDFALMLRERIRLPTPA